MCVPVYLTHMDRLAECWEFRLQPSPTQAFQYWGARKKSPPRRSDGPCSKARSRGLVAPWRPHGGDCSRGRHAEQDHRVNAHQPREGDFFDGNNAPRLNMLTLVHLGERPAAEFGAQDELGIPGPDHASLGICCDEPLGLSICDWQWGRAIMLQSSRIHLCIFRAKMFTFEMVEHRSAKNRIA